LAQSSYKSFFSYQGDSTVHLRLPVLEKPVLRSATNKSRSNEKKINFDAIESGSSYYCGHLPLNALLDASFHDQPCILSFHTRQKLEFVKALLDQQ